MRTCTFAVLAVLTVSHSEAQAEKLRLTCKDFTGNRLHYVGNPRVKEHFQTTINEKDAITGVNVEIVFDSAPSEMEASLTRYGNVNTGGKVESHGLTKIGRDKMLSFVGYDTDGGAVMFSFFPETRKGIWTIHHDTILNVLDKMALGKTFIADCAITPLAGFSQEVGRNAAEQRGNQEREDNQLGYARPPASNVTRNLDRSDPIRRDCTLVGTQVYCR